MNVDLPSINLLSLCSGVGGLDLGARLAVPGARTVCFVENEATAVEKLAARMEDGTLRPAPVWSDLKTFDGRPWNSVVDIAVAGYPCQPFSCAGKQRGAADPRHLWPHVARVVDECGVPVVFLENVENHLRIGYEQVRGELRELGFEIKEGIFSAEEVGAPHLRKRLFILAHREERGRGILRESSWSDRLADWRGAELENAAWNGQYGPAWQDGGRRRGVRPAGYELADAVHGFVSYPRRVTSEGAGSRSAGANVANAEVNHGRRELKPGLTQAKERNDRGRRSAGGCALFPPGPDDLERWRTLLRADPTVEPAVCRIPDGASSRVDRLRACGNGVVPLVAAYAFVSLARAAIEE